MSQVLLGTINGVITRTLSVVEVSKQKVGWELGERGQEGSLES